MEDVLKGFRNKVGTKYRVTKDLDEHSTIKGDILRLDIQDINVEQTIFPFYFVNLRAKNSWWLCIDLLKYLEEVKEDNEMNKNNNISKYKILIDKLLIKEQKQDKKLKILITGGQGFIGTNLSLYLRDLGHEITVYDAEVEGCTHIKHKDIKYYNFSPSYFYEFIIDKKVNDFDIIINLASLSHVDTSIDSPSQFHVYNSQSTNDLLEVCKKNNYKGVIIHQSTDEVFGDYEEVKELYPNGIDEDCKLFNPSSIYSQTKVAQEQICEIYKKYGLNIIIVRACNIMGRHQDKSKLIPKIIDALKNDKPVKLYGNGNQKRQWLHVDHLCKYYESLIKKIVNKEATLLYYHFSSIDPSYRMTNRLLVRIISLIFMRKKDYKIEYIKDRPNHDKSYCLTNNKTQENLGISNEDIKYNFNQLENDPFINVL